jgi:CubicO group peptidase (beta-lactamase class C family)
MTSHIKFLFFITSISFFSIDSFGQNYFPPINPDQEWQTLSPKELDFCNDKTASFYSFLEDQETKGFILLKDGKIVLEKYFGTFTKDSLWYWASAGKTLTAFLVGKAQEEKLLSIQESSSNYLGLGWSNCTPEQEYKIKILHHLSMTTGLNDEIPDNHCTLKSCLTYKAEPGKRWAYHNAPYTLLETIVTKATKTTFDNYTNSKIGTIIGMKGKWFKSDYNNLYFSNLRSMARFGLLIQNNGIWEKDTLMKDSIYLNQMINSSQSINPSYGYLWWLNGKSSYMVPTSQIVIPGSYATEAPNDVISAIGKNGQIISISKEKGWVFVRMGKQKNTGEVPTQLVNSIWENLNTLTCKTTGLKTFDEENISIYPNPSNESVNFNINLTEYEVNLIDITGKVVISSVNQSKIDVSELQEGLYTIEIKTNSGTRNFRFIKN